MHSRQYSGRIVTISNAEIFEQPVFNYSRDFPYIWEEMVVPISYKDNLQIVSLEIGRASCRERV